MQEVMHFLRKQAKRVLPLKSAKLAFPGAMLVVQRFGSALNLNVHFHALALDGVYVLDAFGEPAFFELPQPTLGELTALVGRVAARVVELLRKRGIWQDAEEEDAMAEENPMLSRLAQASMHGTLAFGNGFTRPVRLQDGKPRQPGKPERAGTALGFSLDAEVRVSAWNRLHRERLCRYLLRPPLAKGRLTETMEGTVAFELKTPWPDGTRVIFFNGEELVGRLAALVPPPRMHLVHYYGVLAPNARNPYVSRIPAGDTERLRSKVVPQVEESEETLTVGAVCWEESRSGKTVRRRWVPWAKLLLRTFGVDVFDCPTCHGRMQRIAWITQPRVIKQILHCVNQKAEPPPTARVQACVQERGQPEPGEYPRRSHVRNGPKAGIGWQRSADSGLQSRA